MIESRQIGWPHRIFSAALTLITNLVVWVVIPNFLSSFVTNAIPTTSFTSTLVITYGVVVTALQTLGSLTKGMAVSVPFSSGSYIASAYYIFVALNGGNLSIAYQGIQIQIVIPLLTFLLILPSLFNALRVPIAYLLEDSEAGREAKDLP